MVECSTYYVTINNKYFIILKISIVTFNMQQTEISHRRHGAFNNTSFHQVSTVLYCFMLRHIYIYIPLKQVLFLSAVYFIVISAGREDAMQTKATDFANFTGNSKFLPRSCTSTLIIDTVKTLKHILLFFLR